MGRGNLSAVATVFPGIPDFICHFHFLRDAGKDFLEDLYQGLRRRLQKHAAGSRLRTLAAELKRRLENAGADLATLAKSLTTETVSAPTEAVPLAAAYSLCLWALAGKRDGGGYGFPFDRPHLAFAERILELEARLPECKDLFLGEDWRENSALYKLFREVSRIAKDPELCRAVSELRWRTGVFDRLRAAMRIAPKGGAKGLNDDGGDVEIQTIREQVGKFRSDLDTGERLAADPRSRKLAAQIDTYGQKLFAEPIEVETPQGPISVQPQRTNNIMEQFFRSMRRDYRRQTGNDTMGRRLQAMLKDTPLVKNLDNPAYIGILLDGKAGLEELFADLGEEWREKPEQQEETDRILPGFRAIIGMPKLPEKVVRLFVNRSKRAKSNRVL
jgi:hypothetical protein